jgi:hypothetical protein
MQLSQHHPVLESCYCCATAVATSPTEYRVVQWLVKSQESMGEAIDPRCSHKAIKVNRSKRDPDSCNVQSEAERMARNELTLKSYSPSFDHTERLSPTSVVTGQTHISPQADTIATCH